LARIFKRPILQTKFYTTELFEAIYDLHDFFDQNRIYFNSSICEKLDSYLQKTNSISVDFEIILELEPADEEYKTRTKDWRELTKKAKEEVTPIRKILESLFRDLLGVNQEKQIETSDLFCK
jgi:hypothetical protein